MAQTHHEEKALGRTYDLRLFRRLLSYLKPYKAQALISVILLFLTTPLALAGPPLTKAAIDLFLIPDQAHRLTTFEVYLSRGITWFGLDASRSQGIFFIALLFLLAQLTSFAVQYVLAMILQMMGQNIMFDLREQIFAKLQKLPIKFYDRTPLGRLMTRLTTDVDTINEMFTGGVIVVIGDIAMASFIVIYMFKVNWRLALVSFAILPLLIVLTIWFRRGTRAAFRDIRMRVARINAFLQEHLSGMSVVQLFNREDREQQRFDELNEGHRRANVNTVFYFAVFYPAVEFIGMLGVALLIWFGGGQVLSNVTTLGTLIAFIQLTRAFYEPISDISDRYNVVQAAMASAERIFELLDQPVRHTSPAQPRRLDKIKGRIEFRHVWFAYQNEDWVLKDVSFIVEPGERVAFVGATGAGKTSLTNLLLRFYDIQRGQILLDDVDITEFDPKELRSYFSVVLQDVFLFSGDVARNIRLGNNAITDEKLQRAACEVHADQFIRRLKAGYGTTVHERGAGFSMGQKQLISFARALAFDAPVLILDEATSSIDTETEIAIREGLERLMTDRTSIMIAHRLSTVESVDRIIVLHHGEIRESGTHQQLLALRGLYWHLYQMQGFADSISVAV